MITKIPFFFFRSMNILKSDKKMILLALFPVIIGFAFYYFFGQYAYNELSTLGSDYIAENYPESGWINSVFSWVLILLLGVVINWTFFIFISMVASPFNDLISARVEVIYGLSKENEDSFSKMIKRIPSILLNEVKKLGLIVLLAILNFFVGFIFPPLTFIIGGLILSISFTDYSWSRNEYTVSQCTADLRKGFLPYLLGGVCFMFLISIPLLNLFFLPLAVVFFTVIYCELRVNNEKVPV